MANMDKQETPPCLIALCGNGKFLTRNLTNKSPFLRKLFNVCTHALILQSSSVARRANNEFVVFHQTDMLLKVCMCTSFSTCYPLFSNLFFETEHFLFSSFSFFAQVQAYAQTFIWLLQQNQRNANVCVLNELSLGVGMFLLLRGRVPNRLE